ncbi:MAG: hypothetical protein RLZZ628_3268 [Bacteroidota bacterium]|jgi:membrane associated rhomboid family serine protease
MPSLSLTAIIVIMTCLISYQAFNDPASKDKLLHHPYYEKRKKEYYRMITSGFVHSDFMHLFLNMFVLWQFGGAIESLYIGIFGDIFGRICYLLLYISTLFVTDYLTYRKYQDDYQYRSLGASAAVSAMTFISILINPWGWIFVMMIPMPFIVMGILYLGYTYYQAKQNPFGGGIDHLSHLIGSLYGIAFTVALKPEIILHFLSKLMEGPHAF